MTPELLRHARLRQVLAMWRSDVTAPTHAGMCSIKKLSEVRQRKTPPGIPYTCNLRQKPNSSKQSTEKRLPEAGGWGKEGKVGQRMPTCSSKTNNVQGSRVVCGDNTVLCDGNMQRAELICSCHKKKKRQRLKVMDGGRVLSQCVRVVKHPGAHFQYLHNTVCQSHLQRAGERWRALSRVTQSTCFPH